MSTLGALLARLRRLRHASPPPRSGDVEAWSAALPEEIAFWREVILDPSHPYAGDIPWRLQPDVPLQPYLIEMLADAPGETVRILDVGAGPATVVGKVWPGRTVEITAIDPLAERYAELFAAVGATPPVPTRFGHAERVAEQFGRNAFDLVFSHNALDHSYAPLLAIEQALAVLRPGGFVFLRHNENEAVHAAYGGLHQWNFSVEDDAFLIWNRAERIRVFDHLRGAEAVEARRWLNTESGNTMVDVRIRAKA